jgi:hypothetical protein
MHNSGDHSLLREHLKKNRLANVANSLGQLHLMRKQCDYDDTVPNLQVIYEQALRSAKKLMSQL